MKAVKIILTSIAFFFFLNGFSQKYEVESVSVVFYDGQRGNRRIPADIFYPAGPKDTENDLIGSNTKKFPVICFGHGYLISGKWYADLCDILVPEGYILMIPRSESGLFPSHMTLARDLNFALNEILTLNTEKSFPLYNRIDTVKCIMGHSMGGGSSFLAASLQGNMDAIVSFAPYDTRPSAEKAASEVKVPALIFAGSNDCITPPDKHQVPIFNSLASTDKTYILIEGGTHCYMGVSHPKCDKFERISGCSDGSISKDEQLTIIRRYLIPWLNFYLRGDKDAGMIFDSLLTEDETIVYMQSRPLLPGFEKF